MTSAEKPLGRSDPEFQYDPASVVRFERDHAKGPTVGFVMRQEVEAEVDLVVLEHRYVTHPKLMSEKGAYCVTLADSADLVYTPGEWVAFYVGAREGDYDLEDDQASI